MSSALACVLWDLPQLVFKSWIKGTSLVVQWLRIRLPMQGTRVWALVWEDPTCCSATREATAMRSPHTTTRNSPRLLQLENAHTQQRRPNAGKTKLKKKKAGLKKWFEDFSGGPVVRTPRFHCRGTGSIPGPGTKIPYAARRGQNNNKTKKTPKQKQQQKIWNINLKITNIYIYYSIEILLVWLLQCSCFSWTLNWLIFKLVK